MAEFAHVPSVVDKDAGKPAGDVDGPVLPIVRPVRVGKMEDG